MAKEEDVQMPLSGNVTQSFFPLTINLGRSSDQAMEKEALAIASYGRQLGRIGDAMIVLLNVLHDRLKDLPPDEAKAIVDLKCMLHELANKKKDHGAKHILWPELK